MENKKMTEKLKQKILEFVGLAKECPGNLQAKCFELLLSNYLENLKPKLSTDGDNKKTQKQEEKSNLEEKKKPQQEDILETDLHVKARNFLKKGSLSVEHLNQLFYKEDGNFLPLYDDLKTTQAGESQIRISLLHALLKGMHSGDFEFNGESVREEAQTRKCYDAPNFAKNFKTNQNFFDGFEKYNKKTPTLRLSTEGKDRLLEIIKEMQ
jgi:hypothetical protein